MPSSDFADSELISRSVHQPANFAAIFERHSLAISAYAARRVGPIAAEDIVSETFLVAFRKRGTFDEQVASALPWLYGIASRLIRKHRATEARHWRSVIAEAGHRVQHDDSITDTEDRLDARESARRLLDGIGNLSPDDRETLLLFACEEMTYDEVAKAQQIPVGTVKSRLNRVRRKLDQDAPRTPNGGVRHDRRRLSRTSA